MTENNNVSILSPMSELDALIERARASTARRLPKDHLDTLRTQFWMSVDDRLDRLEQEARQRMLRG